MFKWAPQRNAKLRNAVIQAELYWRDEGGALTYSDGVNADVTSAYQGEALGAYAQAVYQFMPQWRAGLRYDWLGADNALDNNPGGEFDLVANDDEQPDRWSAMADYSRSEFSRLRLQLNHDRSRPGREADTQLLLQYIFSMGAHAAHQF